MAQGGWLFFALVSVTLSIAAVEWVQLAARGEYRASRGLALLWVWLFLADRRLPEADILLPGLALLLIVGLGWTINRFRQGEANSMAGFAFTLAGGVYLGGLGAHAIALRALPDGGWWIGLTVPAVWLADSTAYLVGKRWGRTRLMPEVSPKKTWEGYIAGIVGSALGTAGLALLWRSLGASPAVTPVHGAIIGLLAGAIGPLGDLGISTLKRQVGAKDSGGLIPGHGGLLDRMVSVIIALPLGYYYVVTFAL